MLEALVFVLVIGVLWCMTPQGVAFIIGWRATRRRRDGRRD